MTVKGDQMFNRTVNSKKRSIFEGLIGDQELCRNELYQANNESLRYLLLQINVYENYRDLRLKT